MNTFGEMKLHVHAFYLHERGTFRRRHRQQLGAALFYLISQTDLSHMVSATWWQQLAAVPFDLNQDRNVHSDLYRDRILHLISTETGMRNRCTGFTTTCTGHFSPPTPATTRCHSFFVCARIKMYISCSRPGQLVMRAPPRTVFSTRYRLFRLYHAPKVQR